MKKLNQHSTIIFCELLNKLADNEYVQLQVHNFMPLTLELIDRNIKTPFGIATLYSLMHHFRQNGDLMRDPEMTFLVVDERKNSADCGEVAVYPQSYQLDPLGIFEESVKLNHHETVGYLFRYQAAHCSFANLWLQNIKAQGFLE